MSLKAWDKYLYVDAINDAIASLYSTIKSPRPEDVVKVFKLTDPKKINIIILGQDPYPNPNHATGIAFSVPPETDPLPATLKVLFAELKQNYGIIRTNGDLTDWVRQGVLLLNASLTYTDEENREIHYAAWRSILKPFLRDYVKEYSDVLIVALGNKAASICPDDHEHVLHFSHPSPLSAKSFLGCQMFRKIDEHLLRLKKQPIKWG
ncbi:MAG: uracil-DNA glycosylase [Spirochaetes bacterium]|nr:uracil-DNA glycosylase [Spirochaetota bacterium]